MKRTKWTRAAAILFSMALALVMIGVPATALANVTAISFSPASPQTILVGGTVTISTTLTQSGTTTNPTYSWSASPSGVVGFSSTNTSSVTLTGLTAGTTTVSVTAQDDGDRAATPVLPGTTQTYSITVSPMSISPSSVTVGPSAPATLTASSFTGTITGWTSSNPAVATVASSGASTATVTAVGSGTATITATNTPAGGAAAQTATATVTVPTVTLSPASQTLTSGSATTTLTLSVANGGSVIGTGATVNWSNDNTAVGALSAATSTVNSSGVATINYTSSAAATNGTSTITATVGGFSRQATVTVSTAKHLDIQGPASLDKTTRTGTYTVYLRNPDNTVYTADSTSTVHWSWSSSYLSLTSDSINTNRAHMHNGEAHIQLYAKYNTPSGGTKLYAWINDETGGKVFHTITISGLSSLPQTGQDMTLVYLFGGLSAALLAAAGVWYGIRKKNNVA